MKTCSFQYLKNLTDFLKIETEGFNISKFHFENTLTSFVSFKILCEFENHLAVARRFENPFGF
ncbi:MAG: hypothetical protein COV98_02275 [Candidatus Altarchaeum sp. CG12_big_fil_rev_8_21_14_0_65_33_22]|nr:MAG: hypothetical protein AUK59_07450 [Candidatus Altarchaeum sp. CG2_30_32_3053]PIN67610.1 MAG: hypothetical protein COV98_02275 [Candidatus Altarchaeum sp. CG12_big_fil_rev_8_21_14_0_65_33_22]PIV28541.1 MAG: hypothetical protein COS36_01815 [Candidatus Altarchaeum sp. CG03_land_8_20_14_0_80_32_618]